MTAEEGPNNSLLFELIDVKKTYTSPIRGGATVTALSAVSLQIMRGEFVGIVGRSGEGKSTLLALLGGLDTPSAGTILYRGTNMHKISMVEYRRHQVGFVFQMFHLLPGRSALENVALGLTVAGSARRYAREEAKKWLASLGLEQRMWHKAEQLSGGERQRVAIARAMIKKPTVLLADEPTGNLDDESRKLVLSTLQQLNKTHGVTVILVTHQRDDAEQYSDRVVEINNRSLVALQ